MRKQWQESWGEPWLSPASWPDVGQSGLTQLLSIVLVSRTTPHGIISSGQETVHGDYQTNHVGLIHLSDVMKVYCLLCRTNSHFQFKNVKTVDLACKQMSGPEVRSRIRELTHSSQHLVILQQVTVDIKLMFTGWRRMRKERIKTNPVLR